MRLYIKANRPDSARRLWKRLPTTENSVWIRYSAALIEFVSWKVLREKGSSQHTAESLLVQAIKSNTYCAYYLAFLDDFGRTMEYTEEVQDATEQEPLEEAIEYCNSEQIDSWRGTEGALAWVRQILLRGLQGEGPVDLEKKHLDWESKLKALEEAYHENQKQDETVVGGVDEEEYVDVGMYAGMFRTTMEMLKESGVLV
jgi:hypothetical protein